VHVGLDRATTGDVYWVPAQVAAGRGLHLPYRLRTGRAGAAAAPGHPCAMRRARDRFAATNSGQSMSLKGRQPPLPLSI